MSVFLEGRCSNDSLESVYKVLRKSFGERWPLAANCWIQEGADLDVEALKELEVQGPPKAVPEASATGEEPLSPPKTTRARGGSPAPKRRKWRFPSLRGEGQVFDLRDQGAEKGLGGWGGGTTWLAAGGVLNTLPWYCGQVRDDKGESWVAIPESTGARGWWLVFWRVPFSGLV